MWSRYKCYVCNESFTPDELGRVRLPLYARGNQEVWFRVVCNGCYEMIASWWNAQGNRTPIIYHGF